jgi:hypothetical protein
MSFRKALTACAGGGGATKAEGEVSAGLREKTFGCCMLGSLRHTPRACLLLLVQTASSVIGDGGGGDASTACVRTRGTPAWCMRSMASKVPQLGTVHSCTTKPLVYLNL